MAFNTIYDILKAVFNGTDAIRVEGSSGPGSDVNVVNQPVVSGLNPSDDPTALRVDANGYLLVNPSGFASQNLLVQFNEVTGVVVGSETDINTYTAPSGMTSYLLSVYTSGENRAEYNIYHNAALLDKQYTNVAITSTTFDYKTGSSSVPGFIVPIGNTITISTINSGNGSAKFNSKLLILQVT